MGMDLNGDGGLDLVMKMSDKQSTEITFATPGTGTNDSPSNTTFGSFAGAIALTASTYKHENATAYDSGKVTGTATKVDNAWVTFAISFANLQAAIRIYAVSSTDNKSTFASCNLTYSNTIAYIAFTSTQGNAINQDLFGTTGNLSSTSTFASLGAMRAH